jgi:hypothetical protein
MVTSAGELRTTNGHKAKITGIDVGNVNGKMLIFSASMDGIICAWDKNE